MTSKVITNIKKNRLHIVFYDTQKEITRKALAEVVSEYDFSQNVEAPLKELLGIEQQVTAKGIINLDGMAQFINMVYKNNLRVKSI